MTRACFRTNICITYVCVCALVVAQYVPAKHPLAGTTAGPPAAAANAFAHSGHAETASSQQRGNPSRGARSARGSCRGVTTAHIITRPCESVLFSSGSVSVAISPLSACPNSIINLCPSLVPLLTCDDARTCICFNALSATHT